jgi:hypothetical protein
MYEVSCAVCSASFEYNLEDYIHVCPFCSSGFVLDFEDGSKQLIGDHFIIPNRLDREHVANIFYDWIGERYHRKGRPELEKEFRVLGAYGVCLPFWVISAEVHTYWCGQTQKDSDEAKRSANYGERFVREDGRFSRRYRWAILARRNPKEHWGLDRVHHPREPVAVDWDGFPLDESLGVVRGAESTMTAFDQKQVFKFEHSNGLTVMGTQIKEAAAIARARDQIQEYHRRIAKLRVGFLYEHRTETEIVGVQLIHVPFWILRYAYIPKSFFRFVSPVRERRLMLQGLTGAVLEAELPINSTDKIMVNMMVTGVLAFISLGLSVFMHPLFFFIFVIFGLVCGFSALKVFRTVPKDADLAPTAESSR